MNAASREAKPSHQVNFTLDAHWQLALRLVAAADEVSVPDLVRPVIVRYLRNRLREDDLREAVARIERVRRSGQGVPDDAKRVQTGDRPHRKAKATVSDSS
jgi:hypothetical protein